MPLFAEKRRTVILDLNKARENKEIDIKEADKLRILLIDFQEKLMSYDLKKHSLERLQYQVLDDILKLSNVVAQSKD